MNGLAILFTLAGTHVGAHRALPVAIHRLRYDNDAASARIRLGRDGGVPSVSVLQSCTATPTC